MSWKCWLGHKWFLVKQIPMYRSKDGNIIAPTYSEECCYVCNGPKLYECLNCRERKFEEDRKNTNAYVTSLCVEWALPPKVRDKDPENFPESTPNYF